MKNWKEIRSHPVVKKTIRATLIEPRAPTKRTPPLRPHHLAILFNRAFSPSGSYDDLLALAITVTGFGGLMRLGELVAPVLNEDRDPRKVIKRSSVVLDPGVSFRFILPYHKADPLFKGSEVVVVRENSTPDFNFVRVLHSFLSARDRLHATSGSSYLFLRRDGTQPSRRWYLRYLTNIDPALSGHSLRSGGATFLANKGVDSDLIRRLGRWSSSSWEIYLRDHGSVALGLTRNRLRST